MFFKFTQNKLQLIKYYTEQRTNLRGSRQIPTVPVPKYRDTAQHIKCETVRHVFSMMRHLTKRQGLPGYLSTSVK